MNIFKTLKWCFTLLILAVVIGGSFLFFEFNRKWNQLPTEEAIQGYYIQTTEDQLISPFIPMNELPKHTNLAILAVQNSYYITHGSAWRHCLWDIVKRSLAECDNKLPTIAARHMLQQQNAAAVPPKKLDTLVFGLKMEAVLTREAIFELILNDTFYGRGAYGISKAANIHFEKPANKLTIAESALLAGLIEAPDSYSPIRYPARAKKRRDFVLSEMKNRGMISNTEWKIATDAALHEKAN